MKVIGLYSPVARSGKGTAARTLIEEYGYVELQFSAPIKAAWLGLLVSIGADDLYERTIEGDLKEEPLACFGGLSFRDFAEHIGHGLRDKNPDLWITVARRRIESLFDTGRSVVVSDMRYLNEYELVRSFGGIMVRLERPGFERGFKHPSEGRLDSYKFDHKVMAHSPEIVKTAIHYIISQGRR